MPKGSRDDWVEQARAFVAETGDASASRLSRKLGLPMNATMSILEQLEREGLISVADRKTGVRNVRAASGALEQPRHPEKRRRLWEEVLLGWLQRRRRKD